MESNKLAHAYAGVFSDYIANIRTIITLRLGRSTEAELMHRYEEQKPALWQTIRVTRLKWGLIGFAAMVFKTGLIAIALVLFHHDPHVQIGSIVMLIGYLRSFSDVFYSIGEMYQEIVKQATDYRSVDIINDAYQHRLIAENDMSGLAESDWHTLDTRDLSFAYQDMDNRSHILQGRVFCRGAR